LWAQPVSGIRYNGHSNAALRRLSSGGHYYRFDPSGPHGVTAPPVTERVGRRQAEPFAALPSPLPPMRTVCVSGGDLRRRCSGECNRCNLQTSLDSRLLQQLSEWLPSEWLAMPERRLITKRGTIPRLVLPASLAQVQDQVCFTAGMPLIVVSAVTVRESQQQPFRTLPGLQCRRRTCIIMAV
jgi:hypothetical protein